MTPKGRRMGSVPMSPEVAQTLARLKQRQLFTDRDCFVFAGENGGPVGGSALCRRYDEAGKRANVKRLTFHELRHTFGSVAATAALSGRELQDWMGHADLKTTQRSGPSRRQSAPPRAPSAGRPGSTRCVIGAVVALGAVELSPGRRRTLWRLSLRVSPRRRRSGVRVMQNAGPSSPPITILSGTRRPRFCGGAPFLCVCAPDECVRLAHVDRELQRGRLTCSCPEQRAAPLAAHD